MIGPAEEPTISDTPIPPRGLGSVSARAPRADRPSVSPSRDHRPPSRRSGRTSRVARAVPLILLLGALTGACRESEQARAGRILERHRGEQKKKPLPGSGSIRIRLSPSAVGSGGSGALEIEWEGPRYREEVSSAGMTTVRGIQGTKAFYVDEDGVTRVGSEPVLADLITRSYFWRRAYLFGDRERASLEPAGSGPTSETVVLRPRGGNPLRLTFSRRDARLLSAEAPRFRLEFDDTSRFRDSSRPDRSSRGEIVWTGLPTAPVARSGGRRREGPLRSPHGRSSCTRSGTAGSPCPRVSPESMSGWRSTPRPTDR